MARTILVLEDDDRRQAAMRRCLSEQCSGYDHTFFDNAPGTLDWLQEHLSEVALLCLDHDLGPNRVRDGEPFDPGTGRDVVDYLVTQKPRCPVIIHSTNSPAAVGMEMALQESGWKCSRITPFNDLGWVGTSWVRMVRKCLGRGRPAPGSNPALEHPGGTP